MANSVSRTLLIEEAARRGWRTEEVGAHAYFLKVIHPDGRWDLFRGTCPMRSSAIGFMIVKNKHLTMDFAASLGFTTPAYQVVDNLQQATDFLSQNTKIVIKPADGARTEGVTVGVTDPQNVEAAFTHAKANSDTAQVIVQKHLEGNLYRLLVLDGKFIAGSWRYAASVEGDGVQTVEALIAWANQDPRRGKDSSTPLKYIDAAYARAYLGEEAYASVLGAGERVAVSDIDSVSAGGEAVNVTDEVHEDWRRVCVQLANEAGLFIAGYDVICDDISQPLPDNYIPLLEINAEPGMKLHEYPTGGGEPVHLAPLLLDAVFPKV